jgi:phage/plasmid-associated DNA primase
LTVTIPPAERDHWPAGKFKARGVLAWLIEGCGRWQQNDLKAPDGVKATTDYLDSEDALAAWMDECCDHDADASLRANNCSARGLQASRAGEFFGSSRAS